MIAAAGLLYLGLFAIAASMGRHRRALSGPWHQPATAPLLAPVGWCLILRSLLAMLPGGPITRDQLAMLGRDNVAAAGAPGLDALGVSATPMAAVADKWLVRYRRHGRFAGRVRA